MMTTMATAIGSLGQLVLLNFDSVLGLDPTKMDDGARQDLQNVVFAIAEALPDGEGGRLQRIAERLAEEEPLDIGTLGTLHRLLKQLPPASHAVAVAAVDRKVRAGLLRFLDSDAARKVVDEALANSGASEPNGQIVRDRITALTKAFERGDLKAAISLTDSAERHAAYFTPDHIERLRRIQAARAKIFASHIASEVLRILEGAPSRI